MNYPNSVLDPIKTFLLAKKQELLDREERLKSEDPFADPDRLLNNAAVDADAAEQWGHETTTAMRDEIDRKLAEVDGALVRIDTGTYGSCTACGAMIDTDRLNIEPTAAYCVDCQRKKVVQTVS